MEITLAVRSWTETLLNMGACRHKRYEWLLTPCAVDHADLEVKFRTGNPQTVHLLSIIAAQDGLLFYATVVIKKLMESEGTRTYGNNGLLSSSTALILSLHFQ